MGKILVKQMTIDEENKKSSKYNFILHVNNMPSFMLSNNASIFQMIQEHGKTFCFT
jgi:hypothetical protein